MMISSNTGAPVSRVTVLVTEVSFPALSVALITMVLAPFFKVTVLLKFPPLPKVTSHWSWPLSAIFTVTGLLVTSLVVPLMVRDAWFVTRLFAGLVTFKVGGTVSTLKVTDFWVAAFPS